MKTSKHLPHIEDLGFIHPIDTNLRAQHELFARICDPLYAGLPGLLTSKIDGAPAFVCGPVPRGEHDAGAFFVGTKSVFNVTPKYYTADTISNAAVENNPELAQKLVDMFTALATTPIPFIVQGDALFTRRSEQTLGDKAISVRPNIITYRLSDPTVWAAHVGVVFHTVYTGATFADLRACWNVYPTIRSASEQLYVLNNQVPMIRPRSVYVKDIYREYVAICADVIKLMCADTNVEISPTLTRSILKYINSYIRTQRQYKSAEDMAYDILLLVGDDFSNPHIILPLCKLFLVAEALKHSIINATTNVIEGVQSSITINGVERADVAEGHVISYGTAAAKIVDRRSFSHANFTQSRSWQ